MPKFYGIKIMNGELSIEDVPKLWRPATEKWLADNT